MTFTNYETREVNCKIVYYGVGASGKYSNLKWIYQKLNNSSSAFTLIPAQQFEAVWFDFLLPKNANVRGFGVRVHLYTITTRNLEVSNELLSSYETIFKGVDAIVFVADSQTRRLKDNIEFLSNLGGILNSLGYSLREIPYVLQLNKRDLSGISSVNQLESHLLFKNEPVIETTANTGVGVLETFQSATNQILSELWKG